MSGRADIPDHLRVFGDLGVSGLSRDRAWRERRPIAVADGDAASAAVDAPDGSDPMTPFADHDPDAMPALTPGEPGGDALTALRAHIGDCTRCVLHTLGRHTVVFGTGDPNADLMFVGEAPGSDEDIQGEPFVGRAGQLLTKIIEAIELKRSDVYIANVIKCRPPGNRNPDPAEVARCRPFLFRQIDIVRPRVIVALGTFAAHTLLETDVPISKLRGRVHEFRGRVKLVPTFHPAFLLRSPDRKRDVWEDMKTVRALLADRD